MPIRHTVQQGECFATLAARYGFKDYQALYDHADNAGLKRIRPNPNVLMPGDVVIIPDRRDRELSLAVDRDHRVKVHRPKKELRVVFKDARGEPLRSEAYTFEIRGHDPVEGTTDGNGALREKVPVGATSATVTIRGRSLSLRLGALTPLADTQDDGTRGAQARLHNLGYNVGPQDGDVGRRTRAAVAIFQHEKGEKVDGELSSALRDLLAAEHGT